MTCVSRISLLIRARYPRQNASRWGTTRPFWSKRYATSSEGSPSREYSQSINTGSGPHRMFPRAMSPWSSASDSPVVKLSASRRACQLMLSEPAASRRRTWSGEGRGSRTQARVERIDCSRPSAYEAMVPVSESDSARSSTGCPWILATTDPSCSISAEVAELSSNCRPGTNRMLRTGVANQGLVRRKSRSRGAATPPTFSSTRASRSACARSAGSSHRETRTTRCSAAPCALR